MKRALLIPALIAFVVAPCSCSGPTPTNEERLINEYKSCDLKSYHADYDLELETKHDEELSQEEKTEIIEEYKANGINGLNNSIYVYHSLEEDKETADVHIVEYCNVYLNALESFYLSYRWQTGGSFPTVGMSENYEPNLSFFIKEDNESLETGLNLIDGTYRSPNQINYDGNYLNYLIERRPSPTGLNLFRMREIYLYYDLQLNVCTAYKDGDGYVFFYVHEPKFNDPIYWVQVFHFNSQKKLTKFFEYSAPREEYDSIEYYGRIEQYMFSYDSSLVTPTYDLTEHETYINSKLDYLYICKPQMKVGYIIYQEGEDLPVVTDAIFSTSYDFYNYGWFDAYNEVVIGSSLRSEEGSFSFNAILLDFQFKIKGRHNGQPFDKTFYLNNRVFNLPDILIDDYQTGTTTGNNLYFPFNNQVREVNISISCEINLETESIVVGSGYNGISVYAEN